jgi:hypothetical protein
LCYPLILTPLLPQYYLASDETTAVNYGQGSLVVTLS